MGKLYRDARMERAERCSHGVPKAIRCASCDTMQEIELRRFLIEQGRRLGKKSGESITGTFCPGFRTITVTMP